MTAMTDEITKAAKVLGVVLNAGQFRAVGEILDAIKKHRIHLLTGYAGVGKTVVVQVVAIIVLARKLEVVMCAPTHQAVSVLAKKMRMAGIEIPCLTLARLLSLSPKPRGDRLVFVRRKNAEPIEADVILLDECSMVSSDVMDHIRVHLIGRGLLYSGDPAQLPPVGEDASETFATTSRSHLDTIVRQAADNPIIAAAHQIRMQQGGPIDWSWCRAVRTEQGGVYLPGDALHRWMQKAFTSAEFAADPTSFRYLAWTNRRVADVNAKVRGWLYGDNLLTPFVPGERALLRAPIVDDEQIIANTNEEAVVTEIEHDEYVWTVEKRQDVPAWSQTIPTWKMTLRRDDETTFDAQMVRATHAYEAALNRIRAEADRAGGRWLDLHVMKQFFARFQAVYARTVHTAQGETHKHTFLDVPDIRQRARDNPLETQQLCYVGATRPTTSLILAGV